MLNVGVVGCGPIAQFAHFEACVKANNARLYAICDRADDLVDSMSQIWHPARTFTEYDQMLEDPKLDAVIIATADEYHVPLALKAVEASKHVLIEKPLSQSLDACLELKDQISSRDIHIQVGHMKRFDEGVEYAKQFVEKEMGEVLAIKAWYADNTHRYTMTDNLQPLPLLSKNAIEPSKNWKGDLLRYYLLAHGSHLLDTAMHFGGKIGSLRSRIKKKNDFHCWFIDVEYVNGVIGHLDLTIKLRGDWHEGFTIYGSEGSVFGKTYNPWFYKSSDVECYSEVNQMYSRPLAADGFSYRRQLEHFAEVILNKAEAQGTDLEEGIEVVKGMMAISRSTELNKTIYLDTIKDGVL